MGAIEGIDQLCRTRKWALLVDQYTIGIEQQCIVSLELSLPGHTSLNCTRKKRPDLHGEGVNHDEGNGSISVSGH